MFTGFLSSLLAGLAVYAKTGSIILALVVWLAVGLLLVYMAGQEDGRYYE